MISLNKYFPDPICLTDAGMVGSSRTFRLMNEYRYVSSFGEICVPKDFITDGASIPKVFWSIISPFDDYFGAAVIHDYLYNHETTYLDYSRKECDLIFKEAMFNLGVPWFRRETIYRAVQTFGGNSFRKIS